MPVHIKLIKNNIKSSNSYGKYFGKHTGYGVLRAQKNRLLHFQKYTEKRLFLQKKVVSLQKNWKNI